MNKEPLLRDVAKVRVRLSLFGLTRMALNGLFGGSVAGALVLIASRLWPLLYSKRMFAAAVAAGLFIGILLGIWRRASVADAARMMDRGEPQDAIMTALDGWKSGDAGRQFGANPAIVRLQREEAAEAARRYASDLGRTLPWPSWKSWRPLVYGSLAAWLMIAALLVLPNPLDERAEALAETKEALEQLDKERQALEEKLEELALPDEEKEKLLTPLDELRESLKESGVDAAEALEELEAAMKQLELAAKEAQAAAERLEAAAAAMTEQRELKPVGEAVQARDAEALAGAIDGLRSRLRELTPAEREALAQALERLAGQQPREGAAGELAAALEQAARQARAAGESAAEGGAAEGSEGGDGLAALEEALARGLTQGELEALARAAAGQLEQSGRQLAEQLAEQGGAVPPAWAGGGSGGGAGQGSGSGAGQGSGGGAGQGSGSGAGQGSGSGAGQGSGGGAGQGSGSGAGQGSGGGAGQGSGGGAGQGSGGGAGQGSGGTGSGAGGGNGAGFGSGGRELVTTPRELQGEGQIETDGGPSTGGKTVTGGKSPIIDGTTRPYKEVYSEYAAEAKQSLGRSQLPTSMQEKVKQYFDQIQPD